MRNSLLLACLLAASLSSCSTLTPPGANAPGDHNGVDLTQLSNTRTTPPLLCANPQSCSMTFSLGNIGYKDGGGAVASWLNAMTVKFVDDNGRASVTTDFDLDNRTINQSPQQNSISISFHGALGQLLKTIVVDVDRNHCGRIGHKHVEEGIPDIVQSIKNYTLTQSALSVGQGVCPK